MTRVIRGAAAAAIAFVCLLTGFAAQAQGQGASGIPRTRDGKPDLSGVWQVLNTASFDIEDHHAQEGVPAGVGVVVGGEIPYQPWALEQRKKNYADRMTEDTDAKCYMPGVPRITYMPFPFRIVQLPDRVDLMYEYIGTMRHVYADGTPHPHGPIEWWMGDSRGKWEGDTFVVDVVHFTDKTRFDKAGNFHSDMLHVVERYTMTDKDHINYEVTIEDPKVFTRPWKMQMPLYRRVEQFPRVLEWYCYGFKDVFEIPADRR